MIADIEKRISVVEIASAAEIRPWRITSVVTRSVLNQSPYGPAICPEA